MPKDNEQKPSAARQKMIEKETEALAKKRQVQDSINKAMASENDVAQNLAEVLNENFIP